MPPLSILPFVQPRDGENEVDALHTAEFGGSEDKTGAIEDDPRA